LRKLLKAAAHRHQSVAIPEVHVPPAPLPGPPRFSPSLDDWLQAILTSARAQADRTRSAALLEQAAETLIASARAVAAPPAAPPHEIAPTLASILAQPAFHEQESATEAQVRKSLWERFGEWLANMLDRLFSGLFGAASATPLVGRAIAAITIALIAFLVLLVAYRFARYLIGRRRGRLPDDAGEVLPAIARAAELYARAREAAAQRRYALAISLVFRAGLMHLDQSGLVAYDPARTAGEYRRAVRRTRAKAADKFDDLARTFTLATYAELPAGENEWLSADTAYRRLEPLVVSSRSSSV
jgi:hypothetical protein